LDVFRGSLAHYRLELILPALFQGSPWNGRLRLERGPVQRTFFIENGMLQAESSSVPSEHLTQVLANRSLVEASLGVAAFTFAEQRGVWVGRVLIERGHLTSEQLREVLASKARAALFECYEWESGDFEFKRDELLPQVGLLLRLPLIGLHREALERRERSRDGEGPALDGGGHHAMQLLTRAYQHFHEGDYEQAAQVASQALEHAPVPEAHGLYRASEAKVTAAFAEELSVWDRSLRARSLDPKAPVDVSSFELYLHARLKSGQTASELLRSAPTGELNAYRAIRRLLEAGALVLDPRDEG
jgi:hypothetical protein